MKSLLTFFAVLCMSLAINTEVNAYYLPDYQDVGYVSAGQSFTIYLPSGEICEAYPAGMILVSTSAGRASLMFPASNRYSQDTPFTYGLRTHTGTTVRFKGIIRKNY